MSVILQPQKDFPIVRQIANHLDTDTYFVQSVVRDADGAVLDTVNLVDQGGQRFQKRYRVPVDGSGQGAYISIVTSVYTDSGYTTKSSNYGDEENTYLIFDRVTPTIRGGGSGGPGISDIRRVVADELDKREKEEKEIEFPEMPEIKDYTEMLERAVAQVEAVKELVSKIPTDATDTMPMLEGIQNLAEAIHNKDVTPETDMEPLLTEVREMHRIMGEDLDANNADREEFKNDIKETIVETMEESVANTEYVHETSIRPKNMPRKKEREQEAGARKFNLKDLT